MGRKRHLDGYSLAVAIIPQTRKRTDSAAHDHKINNLMGIKSKQFIWMGTYSAKKQ
jgi:hypothetical protein